MTEQSIEQIKEDAKTMEIQFQDKSDSIRINCEATLDIAAILLGDIKDEIKTVTTAFKPHIDNAYKAHKDLVRSKNIALEPFNRALEILKPKMIKFSDEQDRLAAEAQKKADAEQREREAEEKRKAQEEKDKEVETLMEKGDIEKAEQVMDAPVTPATSVYVPPPVKIAVKGAGTSKKWKAFLVDFGKVTDDFKEWDERAANQYATAMKDKAKQPGMEFRQVSHLSGR